MKPEVLTSRAKEILPQLEEFPKFYLAGGTGLALQLGHRISVDLDFFTEKDINSDLLSRIEESFPESKVENILSRSDQLTVEVDGVSISFVKYPFPVSYDFIDYKGVLVLPAEEIAAMKAYSIGRRATYKDYVDLYFVLKENIIDLEEIIKLCNKKYKEKFDKRLFLEQLVYLEDIRKEDIEFLKEEVASDKLISYFETKIKEIEF